MSSPEFPINLYDADDGTLVAVVDRGEGLRQKSWLEEVSQWLQEASQNKSLGVPSRFRVANYPAVLTGERLSSNPIGQAPVTSAFNGVDVFHVLASRQNLGLGTGAITVFGNTAPTVPDTASNTYGRVGGADGAAAAFEGATLPAAVTTQNAATYAVNTGDILKIIVNGLQYDVTLTGTNGAFTAVQLRDSIIAFAPVHAVVTAAGGVRITTHGRGNMQTLRVVNDATGTATFGTGATAPGTVRRGLGGPLNSAEKAVVGVKLQRRILPRSVSVTTTVAGNALTGTDNGLGVIAGDNGLGQTMTGTIDYNTGVISVTTSAAAANGAAVAATFKALKPIDYTQPVRTHKSEEFAIDLK